jgi:hypothetical protein
MSRVILILLLLASIDAYGQNFRSNRKANQAARNATVDLIQKGEFEKIDIIINPNEVKTSIFNIDEIEMLLLISSSFDSLMQFSKEYSKVSSRLGLRVARPNAFSNKKDSLSTFLFRFFEENHKAIQSKIEQSELDTLDKGYLSQLVLYHTLFANFCNEEVENELLSTSHSYIKNYPKSSYIDGINTYFNLEYKPSKWGVGSFLNSGVIVPMEGLQDYLPVGLPINIGIDLHYSRIHLIGEFGPGLTGGLKREFFYQKTWNASDNLIYSTGGLFLGLNVLKMHHFNLMPVVGFSGMGVLATSDDNPSYYDNVSNLVPFSSFTFGANFDYKWGFSDCQSKRTYARGSGKDSGYFITRFSVFYNNPRFEEYVPQLTGGLLFLKVSLIMQYDFKRTLLGKSS